MYSVEQLRQCRILKFYEPGRKLPIDHRKQKQFVRDDILGVSRFCSKIQTFYIQYEWGSLCSCLMNRQQKKIHVRLRAQIQKIRDGKLSFKQLSLHLLFRIITISVAAILQTFEDEIKITATTETISSSNEAWIVGADIYREGHSQTSDK